MTHQSPSLFRTSIHTFFKAAFGVAGGLFGFVMLFIFIGIFADGKESTLPTKTRLTILPNAENVRKELSATSPVLLQIDIKGVIGQPELTHEHVHQQLVESREGKLKDDRVKGILLSIKTPGGTVMDSDGIYHAIRLYKEKYDVPVYAFVDGLCASGGVYVTSAADKIYATETSLVGSVGTVIGPAMNFSKLMETIGIQSKALSAGKNKDMLNPFRPWKEGEEKPLQDIVNTYYDQFVDIVANSRPELTQEALIEQYGANIYPAKQAMEYGFIDAVVATKEEVILALAEKAELEEGSYQMMGIKSKEWVFDLFQEKWNLLNGKISHQIVIDGELPPYLKNQFLYYFPYSHMQ